MSKRNQGSQSTAKSVSFSIRIPVELANRIARVSKAEPHIGISAGTRNQKLVKLLEQWCETQERQWFERKGNG